MKRLALTQHTLRCPLDESTASVTVRTDDGSYPSRRYLDVTTCSLLPSTSFIPPSRMASLPDVMPPVAYVRDVDTVPRHPSGVTCAKRCLAVLNAAEAGAGEGIRCTSGVSDALELARQLESPAIMRLLWLYGG